MGIRRVWIEAGCISCNPGEDLLPEVFQVPLGETCEVNPTALQHPRPLREAEEKLQEAPDSCPVEVIQIETEQRSSSADGPVSRPGMAGPTASIRSSWR